MNIFANYGATRPNRAKKFRIAAQTISQMIKIGFVPFNWLDLLDITLVAALFYQVYKIFRHTATLRGIIVLLAAALVWRLVTLLNMALTARLMDEVLHLGVILLFIIYTPEIRRVVATVTQRARFFQSTTQTDGDVVLFPGTINEIVEASLKLAETYTGALIIIIPNPSYAIQNIIDSGDVINAKVASRLLISIFNPKSPMHDGAVIIHEDTLIASRCVLPTSDNPDVPANMGLRHKSGLGVTEITDALAIVVSEERGSISVMHAGRYRRGVGEDELRKILADFYSTEGKRVLV